MSDTDRDDKTPATDRPATHTTRPRRQHETTLERILRDRRIPYYPPQPKENR